MRNAIVVLTVVAMLAVTVQAVPTPAVYEPFNYATPGTVAGSEGGGDIGFSAAWPGGGGMTTHALATGSPVYPAGSPLTSVGNSVDLRWGNGDARGLSNAIGLNADTFYMSALIEIHATATYVPNVDLGLTPDGAHFPTGEFLTFGITSADWQTDLPRNFYIQGPGGAGNVTGDVVPVSAATYLLVVKVVSVASGNDTAYLKIYEKDVDTVGLEPVAWDLTSTFAADDVLTNLILRSKWGHPDSGDLAGRADEIRLGDSWEDVTGVPEPATLVLLGLGGIGVLIRRKRR